MLASASSPRPGFTIGRLMAAVAVSAGVFTLYRMMAGPGSEVARPALTIPLISVLAMAPVRFAQPRRWVVISTWVITLWPFSIVVLLHIAFAAKAVVYASYSGPPVASPIVQLLEGAVFWVGVAALVATLIGFYLPLIAPDRSASGSRCWNRQLIPVLLVGPVWLAVIGILHWDPCGAFEWFVD